jgi:ABC-2 type transport system permease protein
MLGSVFGRSLFEQRRAVIGWSLGLGALVVIVFLYYPSVRDDPALTRFYEDLPDVAQALSGGAGVDIGSPSGYLSSQLFANMVPLVFIIYGVILGSAAIGREEDRKTAELLFAAPISRRRVVAEKALAGAALLALLGGALFLSLLLGRLLVEIEISAVNLLAASVSSILIGTTFGAFALAVSCGLGRRAHPGAAAGALAFAAFLIYSLAPVVPSLHDWQKASPFYWYLHSNPLASGFDLGDLAVLVAMILVPAVLAAELLTRRDLTS